MYGASFDTLTDDIACLSDRPAWLVGFAMTDDEMVEIEAATAERGPPGGQPRRRS